MNRRRFPVAALATVSIFLPLTYAMPAQGATPAATGTGAPKIELATVSIVRYADKTGEKNFEYMPDSLADAIDASLQKRFEYQREAPKKTDAAMARFRVKNPELDAESAARFCRWNKTDILIFGEFSFDEKAAEIVVRTSISLGTEAKFRELPDRRNPVDATIFKLADLVADDIVQSLIEIAREQTVGKIPTKKEEKLRLRKQQHVVWIDSDWNFGFAGGALIPLNDSFTGYRSPQPTVSVAVERRLHRGFYLGLVSNGATLSSGGIALDFAGVAASAAYHFQLRDRWDIYLLAAGGYYLGRYESNPTCGKNCAEGVVQKTVALANPYAMTRLGLNFLIRPWLSAGFYGQAELLFDKPRPLYFGGAGVMVGFHF